MAWSYAERHPDPGIALFDACLKAGAPMSFPDGATVLEIGCCETDWLHLAAEAWPTCRFIGVDVRTQNVIDTDGRVERKVADVRDRSVFHPRVFDAIVSLSAMEHVGLGHYGDPTDTTGDVLAMANAYHWLKPGGWFYFDVPFDPKTYREERTEYRCYNPYAVSARLMRDPWLTEWVAYSEARNAGTLVAIDTPPERAVDPFHYRACVLTK